MNILDYKTFKYSFPRGRLNIPTLEILSGSHKGLKIDLNCSEIHQIVDESGNTKYNLVYTYTPIRYGNSDVDSETLEEVITSLVYSFIKRFNEESAHDTSIKRDNILKRR